MSLALPAWKTIMPLTLSPLYEFPRWVDFTAPRFWGSALFVVGITASVVALRRRWPGALVGWLWYMLFLVPVSLMAHAGPQVTADRYGYLPTLGLFAPLGAARPPVRGGPRRPPVPDGAAGRRRRAAESARRAVFPGGRVGTAAAVAAGRLYGYGGGRRRPRGHAPATPAPRRYGCRASASGNRPCAESRVRAPARTLCRTP